MPTDPDALRAFLRSVHPYDALAPDALDALLPAFGERSVAAGDAVYDIDAPLEGLYLIRSGAVAVHDAGGAQISALGPRNSFGERGLLRDGRAVTAARATQDTDLLVLPRPAFLRLIQTQPAARAFFDRSRAPRARPADLATTRVETLMASPALTCPPDTPVSEAARRMAEARVSSICVTEGTALRGIVTVRDMSGKVVAGGLDPATPVAAVMTADPLTLPPNAIGSDVLHRMIEHRIGHIPVVEAGRLLGIVTQTDLTRFRASGPDDLIRRIARADDPPAMAAITARIPDLLVQLVASGARHDVVTRLITDVADAVTRRLLALAEANLGPPPVPYLWLACGSQGRQEQTGVTDQDNALMLDDAANDSHAAYFEALASFVCAGLDTCGYVLCPGEMMAINPRWRATARVWRARFRGWIARPDPEAQMLASVMFDLRPVGGDVRLFDGLHRATLDAAARNSIFVAHMTSNALKHAPPLGLLRGLATIRSGDHRDTVDLKMNGVVPVVDLARIHALRGRIEPVNTRARLEAAMAAGGLSARGGQDLLDAYDMIAETRLAHQAARIRAGQPPDNYLAPARLSDFERSHLRDAFVVVKSLQAALGHGTAALT